MKNVRTVVDLLSYDQLLKMDYQKNFNAWIILLCVVTQGDWVTEHCYLLQNEDDFQFNKPTQ